MAKISFSSEQLLQLGYYQKPKDIVFDEETIREIFGHEAAEDEDISRLKEYYVKSELYHSMKSKIPLYVLVGHKGVGKSALLKVLSAEDRESGNISIFVQPDDIIDLDIGCENFLRKINIWEDGLSRIIFRKLVAALKELPNSKVRNEWAEKISDVLFSILGKKLYELQTAHVDISNSQLVSIFSNAIFKEKQITVYLDDLDRGWKNTEQDITNLSAMLNAIRDLSRDLNNLKFRIALRSDVYYAVRTSDETTDKIDGSVLWQKWSNHEILVMLIKRIETFFDRDIDEEYLLNARQIEISHYLDSVFEKRFMGRGHWYNAPIYRVLMSLIRKRPRDLVKLCTLSARKAFISKHKLILTNDLESVFSTYSNDRLTDTGNEYQSELPQIKELLLKMKPTKKELAGGSPCLFPRDLLLQKIENILSMSSFSFKDGKEVTSQSLAAFLYKINFLTARKDNNSGIERIYYDENQYIYNEFTDFGYSFEIHPAYRWALQPSNINDLFDQIILSE